MSKDDVEYLIWKLALNCGDQISNKAAKMVIEDSNINVGEKTRQLQSNEQANQLLTPLRRFFPLLESLPGAFDEFGDFVFVLSGLAESVEFSFTSSLSFDFDEPPPDFTLPVPLALDLPPLLGLLPLEMEVLLDVSCLDFPVFAMSGLDLVEALPVLVSSSLILPVLGVLGSLPLDFPADLGAASTDLLLPPLGVWSLDLPLLTFSDLLTGLRESSLDLLSTLMPSWDLRPDFANVPLDLLEEVPPPLESKLHS